MSANAELFWGLVAELQRDDPRIVEGTIMKSRCVRVGKEFLGLVDHKGSGLVVKLNRPRVASPIEQGVGRPFAPAGKVFGEWVSIREPNRELWAELLREGASLAARRG
jgi:hypothetical protein